MDNTSEGPMYEIRNYWIDPEHFEEWMNWFKTYTAPFFRKIMDIVAIYPSNDVPHAYSGFNPREDVTPANLTWILRWDSKEQRDKAWMGLRDNEEWQGILAERPGGAEYLKMIEAKFVDSI